MDSLQLSKFLGTLLCLMPLMFFLLLLLVGNKGKVIRKYSDGTSWLLIIPTILCFALYPAIPGNDKNNYEVSFRMCNLDSTSYHGEIAWVKLTQFCNYLFTPDGSLIYFLLLATIYCCIYYVYAKNKLPSGYVLYYIVFAFGSVCFTGYGNNTIRAGIGLSCLFGSLISRKAWKIIALFGLAYMFHHSMIIPVTGIIVTYFYKNTKVYLCLWLVCLVLSIANVSFVDILEKFSGFDDRVQSYAIDPMDESIAIYGMLFRWDFVIYSFVPIVIFWNWMKKHKLNDVYYVHLFNTYIIVNSLWLLLIRQPFTDRFAYLSWFLIPILMIGPIVTDKVQLKNPDLSLKRIMALFLGVAFCLNVLRNLFG